MENPCPEDPRPAPETLPASLRMNGAERVLALVGPDDSAQNVVRHAAQLADALRTPLVALHVEHGDDARVQAALDLALQLGGTVVSLTARDMARAVLDYAAANTVTHIVMGRVQARWWPGRKLSKALTRQATAFSLHLLPLPAATPPRPATPLHQDVWEPYLLASLLLCGVTLIGYAAQAYIPQEAMGLVFTGLIAAMASRSGRNAGLFTAGLGFLLWNFFFLPPVETFSVSDPRNVAALLVFLLVGLLTGQLAGRVQQEAATAGARVEALRRISAFSQRFSRAATLSDVLRGAAEEAASVTGAGIVLMLSGTGLEPEACIPEATMLDEVAEAAAEWCASHDVETGTGTSTLASVGWRFLPLHANGKVVGVLGTRPKTVPPPLAQTLATLAGQTSMAVERARMTMQTARAQAQEDSQKLRNALLSSLSHDLRTPLTAIRGAAETLEQAGPALDTATRADLLASISQNTALMTKFLANIMDMARVEAGSITVKRERLRLDALIEAAIARVQGAEYTSVNIAPDASHALADPTLLEQTVVNILENAVKYAPAGSRMTVTATRQGDNVRLAVADEGVGIPQAELGAVFDSFFRATRGDRVAPGTGLGLAIAKAFTEAMDGRISAQSPRPDLPADGLPGTIITVELPAA